MATEVARLDLLAGLLRQPEPVDPGQGQVAEGLEAPKVGGLLGALGFVHRAQRRELTSERRVDEDLPVEELVADDCDPQHEVEPEHGLADRRPDRVVDATPAPATSAADETSDLAYPAEPDALGTPTPLVGGTE